MLKETSGNSTDKGLFRLLSESERHVAFECMKMMASCQLLSVDEIDTVMSVTLDDLRRVVSQYPNIDETIPDTWRVIGMSLTYIGGAYFPQGKYERLGLPFPKSRAKEVGDKWYLLLDAQDGLT
jgi:hypothetical protein